jgi:hypothetical protein
MNEPKTRIDFCIRGNELQLDEMTKRLGLQPTDGWNPRERYLGKEKVGNEIRTVERQRESFGVWHFCTEELVDHSELQIHAEFLLSKLIPIEEQILEIIRSGSYQVSMWFRYVGPTGFSIKSSTVLHLAILCERMDFSFFNTDK